MRKPGLMILGAVVVLVLAGYLIYFLKYRTTLTSYENMEAGFTIKYPKGWTVGETSELWPILSISNRSVRIYPADKRNGPYGVNIYYAGAALVDKEVMARAYKLDRNKLEEVQKQTGEYKANTIYASAVTNISDEIENIPVYYFGIEYGTGEYIIDVRGEEEARIFEKEMLPTFKIVR